MQPTNLDRHKNTTKWFVTQKTIGEGDDEKGTGYWVIKNASNNKTKEGMYTSERIALNALDNYLTNAERDNRLKQEPTPDKAPEIIGTIKIGGQLVNMDSPEGKEYLKKQVKKQYEADERTRMLERNKNKKVIKS